MGTSASTEITHVANCVLLSKWIYDRAAKSVDLSHFKKEETKAGQIWSDDLTEMDFFLANEHEGKMCTFAIVRSESTGAVYLVFRGTVNVADGIIYLSAIPDTVGDVKLHSGFHVSIKSVVDEVFSKLSSFCDRAIKNYDFYITGHSLGGGLSQTFGYLWKKALFPSSLMDKVPKLTFQKVFSLASPLIRWLPLTPHEIQFINEHNKANDRQRFIVPDSMKILKESHKPLDYIVNFVYEKDIVARLPFAMKCRWSVKNVATWAITQVDNSFIKMMVSGVGAPDKVAMQLSTGFIPDVMIGYFPLGHTFLVHGNQLKEVSANHDWYMNEFDKKEDGGADDGWNVTDHLFSGTHGYVDLYRNTVLLKSLPSKSVFQERDSSYFRTYGTSRLSFMMWYHEIQFLRKKILESKKGTISDLERQILVNFAGENLSFISKLSHAKEFSGCIYLLESFIYLLGSNVGPNIIHGLKGLECIDNLLQVISFQLQYSISLESVVGELANSQGLFTTLVTKLHELSINYENGVRPASGGQAHMFLPAGSIRVRQGSSAEAAGYLSIFNLYQTITY